MPSSGRSAVSPPHSSQARTAPGGDQVGCREEEKGSPWALEITHRLVGAAGRAPLVVYSRSWDVSAISANLVSRNAGSRYEKLSSEVVRANHWTGWPPRSYM